MYTGAAIKAREVSFDEELLELLSSEQAWIDTVFAEIIDEVATSETVHSRVELEAVRVWRSADAPQPPATQRPGEMERSPPDGSVT